MGLPEIRQSVVATLAQIDALISAGAQVLRVTAGQSIQSILDTATPGAIIRVQPGTYPGHLILRAIQGADPTKPVFLRPDVDDTLIPTLGRPAAAPAPIVTIQGGATDASVVETALGAASYQLMGLTIQGANPSGTLVSLGIGNETKSSDLAHDIGIDRCVLDGGWAAKRGLAMNGDLLSIRSSVIVGIMKPGQDSQCLSSWQGSHLSIQDCLFDGGTETVMFGGADPTIPNFIPSDIDLGGCLLTRNLSKMRNVKSTVKTTLELKNAIRARIHDSIIENCWYDEQTGHLIDLTVRDQGGTAPWTTLQDILLENLVCRHGNEGVEILGLDDQVSSSGAVHPSTRAARITLRNILWYDVGSTPWGGAGTRRWLYIDNGPSAVTIDHQSVTQSPVSVGIGIDAQQAQSLTIKNSIIPEGKYGISRSGAAMGLPSWQAGVDAASIFDYNRIDRNALPSPTWRYPGTHNQIGAVAFDGTFEPTTPMVGDDGTPIGCDVSKLPKFL